MKKSILALAFSSVFAIALVACGDSGAEAGDSNTNWKKGGSSDPSVIIDARDGEEYRTVRIGNQLWMAENLRFNDTLWMPSLSNNSEADEYGRRYTYDAAMAGQTFIDSGYNEGLCPIGWHLPSMTEFDVMKNFVSEFCPSVDSCLRSAEGWEYAGNDRFGFNAKHSSESRWAYYWTSNPANGVRINTDHGYSYRSNSTDAVRYGMEDSYSYSTFGAGFNSKGAMNYVRCVKGSEEDSAAAIKNYLKTRDETIEYLSSSAAYQAYLSSSSAAEWARVQQGAKVYFNPNLHYDEFVDSRDGQTYGYLQIGNYIWMAENMRHYYKLNDYYSYSKCDSYLSCEARTYEDTVAYYATGVTYPDSLLDQVCPLGWHVSTKAEWEDLLSTSEDNGSFLATDGNWPEADNIFNYNHVTNSTGFTAMATTREKEIATNETYFWTSSDSVRVTIRIDTVYVDSLVPVDTLPVADTVAVSDSSSSDTVLAEPEPIVERAFILDTTRTEHRYHYYVQYYWLYNGFVFKVTSGDRYYVRCVKDY